MAGLADGMTNVLRLLGHFCARRPWRVMIGWVLLVVALTSLAIALGGTFRDAMTAPGTPSSVANERLTAHFPESTFAGAHVVVNDRAQAVDQAAVDAAADRIRHQPKVENVTVRLSPDAHTALIAVTYQESLPNLNAAELTTALTVAAAPLSNGDTRTAVGGEVPESLQGPDGIAEAVGVAVAVLVLVFAFGSMLAAGLPLLIAAAGLGAGLMLIAVLSAFVDISTVSPTLGSMIGLGVGIDYALFMVAAQRRHLALGLDPIAAAAETAATAGRAVVSAGGCVLIGITGLAFCGVPGFAWMGVSAALVVAATMVAALTLLPALLGLAGPRIFSRRVRRDGRLPLDSFYSRTAARTTAAVVKRPVLALLAGITALLALAAPAIGMRLGQNDAGSESADRPTRQAYDLVAAGFGPGANGPLILVADAAVDLTAAQAAGDAAGVASVGQPRLSPDGVLAVRVITPEFGPQDPRTQSLINTVVAKLPAGAQLTGPTAALFDLTRVLGERLWVVIGVVLAATYLLLVMVLRSVLLPLKAVLSNLLSIAACFGVMTMAFQTAWGAKVLGLEQPVPIAAWAPVVLFAILFGLSMDYEIFMISSIAERRLVEPNPKLHIIEGMAGSARIVICAAAIMIAVAAGFAFDSSVMVKIIGVGMVSAILVDVTLVRMLVVPAAMTLLGNANWWFPTRGPGRQHPTGPASPAVPAPHSPRHLAV